MNLGFFFCRAADSAAKLGSFRADRSMQNKKTVWLLVPVFLLYLGLLALGVSRHEPWFDEAQAWLISRDSQGWELFNQLLRYEGSPGLWHLLLRGPAKAGWPYSSLPIIGASFALLGVLLFLWRAPFSPLVKLLFPFSYFILYQYGIIARSYTLLPWLLFTLAILFPKRQQRPFLYVSVLVLLAHVSLPGLIIAFCLGLHSFIGLLQPWRQGNRRAIKRQLAALTLLFAAGLLAVWELRFPPDHSAVHPLPSYQPWFVLAFTFRFFSNALTEHMMISGLVLSFSLWYFWKAETLSLFLLPTLLLGHLLALVYSSPWHEGILFLYWIFCLWVSTERWLLKPAAPAWGRACMEAALILVLLLQLPWTFTAYRNDYQATYSAAKDVAAYLQAATRPTQRVFASGFSAMAVQPFFARNIFANYRGQHKAAFWDWSLRNGIRQDLQRMVLDCPDKIVHGVKADPSRAAPPLPGYTSRFFSGHIFWKDRIFEEDSYVVYERIDFPLISHR